MIPNPILKVLSTLTTHQVQYLLMGGQACVLYGAAEFSRDTDAAILADKQNLARLQSALSDLLAEGIAVPPLTLDYLKRGHAVHFRCRHPEALGIRLDIMSVMRGVAPFDELWQRRRTLEIPASAPVELMDLADLVKAKKTQREKDWPMIRRLVEAHYATHHLAAQANQLSFWLHESRTASMLKELAGKYPEPFRAATIDRPVLSFVLSGDDAGFTAALQAEEQGERQADRLYWQPLRKELETLRHERRKE